MIVPGFLNSIFVKQESVNHQFQNKKKDTVVGDYINTMKTTFDFNFNLNRAIKQHGYT